jgi:nitrogen fixation protein FixH
MKLVVQRNGRQVTGWRKWAIMLAAIPFIALVIAIALVFVLGVALTAGAILTIAIPAALVLALVARVLA